MSFLLCILFFAGNPEPATVENSNAKFSPDSYRQLFRVKLSKGRLDNIHVRKLSRKHELRPLFHEHGDLVNHLLYRATLGFRFKSGKITKDTIYQFLEKDPEFRQGFAHMAAGWKRGSGQPDTRLPEYTLDQLAEVACKYFKPSQFMKPVDENTFSETGYICVIAPNPLLQDPVRDLVLDAFALTVVRPLANPKIGKHPLMATWEKHYRRWGKSALEDDQFDHSRVWEKASREMAKDSKFRQLLLQQYREQAHLLPFRIKTNSN